MVKFEIRCSCLYLCIWFCSSSVPPSLSLSLSLSDTFPIALIPFRIQAFSMLCIQDEARAYLNTCDQRASFGFYLRRHVWYEPCNFIGSSMPSGSREQALLLMYANVSRCETLRNSISCIVPIIALMLRCYVLLPPLHGVDKSASV